MADKIIGLRIELRGQQATLKAVAVTGTEIKKLRERTKGLEKAAAKLEATNKTGTRQYAQLRSQLVRNVKTNIELREEQKRLTSVVRANVTAANTAKGSYNALTAENRKLSIQSRALSDPLTKNAKEFQRLAGRIKTNTDRLKQLDAAMGRQFRNVGDYRGAINGAFNTFTKFAAGITAGILVLRSLNRVFGGSIKTIANFQQANANLATILGKNRGEITELTNDAERLGAVTARQASEVTSLQEAYARLGFTQSEILQLTEATIAGSVSLNAELDQTAELVGAVVNSFDSFDSTNAPEIIDQLTAATNNSALNFGKLSTALPIVAGAANAAGVPFTKLLSLLGKLADSGIDASSSATALRNIFIESAAQGESFEQILESIVRSQDKLTASNDEFGKRAAVSAATLAANIAQTKELEEVLESAGGTAQRVADERLNTLNGAVTLLSSAWEGLILSVDRGDGAIVKNARATVELATAILGLLSGLEASNDELTEQEKETRRLARAVITSTKLVILAAAAYTSYRLSIIASSIAQRVATVATSAWGSVVGIATGKIRLATIATQLFNKATKANVIVAVGTALLTAAAAFGLFSDSAEDAGSTLENDFDERLQATKQVLAELDLALLNTQERARLLRLGFTDVLRGLSSEELKLALQIAEGALEESLRTQNVARSKSNKISAQEEVKLRVETIENINREILKREQERVAALGKSVEDLALDLSEIEIVSEKEFQEALRKINELSGEAMDLVQDFEIDSLFDEEAIDKQEERIIANLRKFRKARIDLERDSIERINLLREEQFITEEEFEIQKETIQQENRELAFQAALDAAQVLSDSVFEIQAAAIQRETDIRVKEAKKRSETELIILQEQLRDGIISETQFREAKSNLDKRAAVDEQRLRKSAFEENKTLATIQAAINTALAVTNALATAPNIIAGIVLAALAAATGIAQIAIIQSQQFEQGGKIEFPAKRGGMIKGPSHEQGGVKFDVGGSPHEARGGEVILNEAQQARAGGDPFFARIGVPGFAGGGQIPTHQAGVRVPVSTVPTTQVRDIDRQEGLNQEDFVDQLGEVINDKEVVVSEQPITETQQEVEVIDGIGEF